jgi:hypothetical protein
MLPTTAQDDALYAIGQYDTHVALCFEQPGAADVGWGTGWVNLSDYPGIGDLVDSIDRSENVDDPCASLTAVVTRDFGDYSLSPLALKSPLNLVGGDFVELLAVGRGIRLYLALSPVDSQPADAAWFLKFDGVIDRLDLSSGDAIGIEARDLGGQLQDRQIENTSIYGTDGGQSVESVIQDILDDWSSPAVTLEYDSPGWNIKKWQQDKSSIAEAIRALSDQIGWELRYKWSVADSAYELTLYNIDRTKTSADATISPLIIKSWMSAAVDGTNVRNVVTVVYKVDPATGERSSVTRDNADSISAYGRKASEIAEAATSQIDNSTDATNFANAVLLDLKDPLLLGSAELICYPHSELGDLYSFPATLLPAPKIFDTAQTLAVVGIQDTFRADGNSTTLDLRGKPSGGYLKWLNLEARRGVGANKKLIAVDGATSLNTAATLGGITVTYDEPTSTEWAYSELYLSTVADFTPSADNFIARGRTNKFIIGGLIPGTTYYIKIIVIDGAGNRAVASAQAITATALVGPTHVDNDTLHSNIIANGDFQVTSPPAVAGDVPPDCWYGASGVGYDRAGLGGTSWGVCFFLETSDQQSGDVCLKVTNGSQSGWPHLVSDFYPCEASGNYTLSGTIKYYIENGPTPTFHGVLVTARILWYDSTKTYISAATPGIGSGNETYTWMISDSTASGGYCGAFLAPTTARYFRVYIARSYATTGYEAYPAYIDNLKVIQQFYASGTTTGSLVTKQVIASKTLSTGVTTDLLNVTVDDPSVPATSSLRVDEDGQVLIPGGAITSNVFKTVGPNGMLWIQREDTNNMFEIVPWDVRYDAFGVPGAMPDGYLPPNNSLSKEIFFTVGQKGTVTDDYTVGLPGCISIFDHSGWMTGRIFDQNGNIVSVPAYNDYVKFFLNLNRGLIYSSGLITGYILTSAIINDEANYITSSAIAVTDVEQISHKNQNGGYLGIDSVGHASLASTTNVEAFSVGGLSVQSHDAVNNGWWGFNWNYGTGQHRRIAAGYAACLMELAGDVTLRVADTGAAGSAITDGGVTALKIVKATGKVRIPQQASLAYAATDSNGEFVAAITPEPSGAVSTHSGLTTDVHGVGTSTVASTLYVDTAVSTMGGPVKAGVQTTTALRALDGASEADKNMRLVEDKDAIYRYDTAGTGADDDNITIVPHDITPPAPGRWFKFSTTTQNHEALTGLLGGATNDHQHLTTTQLNALHARQHAITSTSDHTSSATSGQMLKANADGLPVNATNTDSAVAAAVTASHSNANDPTAGEKAALAGTYGIPADGNRYVTATDAAYVLTIGCSTTGGANKIVQLNATGCQTIYGTPAAGSYLDQIYCGLNGDWGIKLRLKDETGWLSGSILWRGNGTDTEIFKFAGVHLQLPWATASQLLGTDDGKNVINIPYSQAAAASSILQLDASGYAKVVRLNINSSYQNAPISFGATTGIKVLFYDQNVTTTKSGFGVDMSGSTYENSAFCCASGSGLGHFNWGSWDGTTWVTAMTLSEGKVLTLPGLNASCALGTNASKQLLSAGGDFSASGGANTILQAGTSGQIIVNANLASGYAANFHNDGNNENRRGIKIRCGENDPIGTNYFLGAYDGGDGLTGYLQTVAGVFALADISDERLKQDIAPTKVKGLDVINAIKLIEYRFKKYGKDSYLHPIGFTSQDLEGIFPDAVSSSPDNDTKTVIRTALIPVLVQAVQEVSKRGDAIIAEAKARADADETIIADHDKILKDLVKRIETLEKKAIK